jgi:hypothetical protein
VRALVEERYRAAHPGGKPHARQLDHLAIELAYFARLSRREGLAIHRTHNQLARAWAAAGVPWQPTGEPKRDSQLFKSRIKRHLGYLQAMGYVDAWEPVYDARGESSGIVVRLSAVVAQLAVAPLRVRRRGAHSGAKSGPPSRSRKMRTLGHPPGGAIGGAGDIRAVPVSLNSEHGGARAARAVDRRERAALRVRATAALGIAQASGAATGGASPRDVAALPCCRDVDPVGLAIAACRVWQPTIPPKLSEQSERRLEASLSMLDRYADLGRGREGVGRELLLAAVMEAEPPWPGAGEPRSLGGIVVSLHRRARKWRRTHRPAGQR